MGISATWGGGDGDWFNAGNWTEPNPNDSNLPLHYVPDATNDVFFNGTMAYTVTFNGDDAIEGLNPGPGLTSDDLLMTLAIEGGSLTVGADGGGLGFLSTAVGAAFAISDSASFTIVTAMDNAGTFDLNGAGDRTQLIIGLQTTASPVTLTGGGDIVMADSANNDIFINNDASLDNVDNTISGAGAISSNFETLTNGAEGIINATGTLNSLSLVSLAVTNQGLIEDTGAGGLVFTSSENSTTIDNEGGTISASGMGAHVDVESGTTIAGGTLSSSGGGIINIDGADTFDGATNGALTISAGSTVQINDAAQLLLTGTAATPDVIENLGVIALNAGADRAQLLLGSGGGTTMLEGGGKVTLSDNANNLIGGGNNGTVFENVDNTISGAGDIDSEAGRMSFTNEAQGVVDATGANNALTVSDITFTNFGLLEDTGTGGLSFGNDTVDNAGGTISANGSGAHVDFINQFGEFGGGVTVDGGTLATTDGGVFDINSSTLALNGAVTIAGAVAGSGTLDLSSGDTTFSSGSALTTAAFDVSGGAEAEIAAPLTYAGAFSNNGTLMLDDASTFELSGAVSGGGAIDFAAGSAATLTLDAAAQANGQTFANTIGEFSAGDEIDLTGLTFAGTLTPTYDAGTGTLSVTEGGITDTLMLSDPGATNFTLQADGSGGTEVIVCFASGTRIRTPRGDVAVERLAIGDMVVTASGEQRAIRWIGHRSVDCQSHPRRQEVLPVSISAHAFGLNRPMRDLVLSPGHAVCVDVLGEVLVTAGSLVNGATIQQLDVDAITYWHVELDSHDVILAENLPAESYLEMGNREFFAGGGVVALSAAPDGDPAQRTHADFCRPFHKNDLVVDAIRARMRQQAQELGWRLSRELDLHLEVDGRRIDPVLRGATARFAVPAGAKDIWLVSPTARPYDTAGENDGRELGVCIGRLQVVDGFAAPRPVALEDPRLGEGFHGVEDGVRRWTSGRAKLPAALWADCSVDFYLSVELAEACAFRWMRLAEASAAEVERRIFKAVA